MRPQLDQLYVSYYIYVYIYSKAALVICSCVRLIYEKFVEWYSNSCRAKRGNKTFDTR